LPWPEDSEVTFVVLESSYQLLPPGLHTTGRIIKANLSLGQIRAKFCQLIASLSMFITFCFVLKVRLKDLKF